METQTLAIAIVAAIPATIASLASWRNAKAANHQTNGLLQEPLKRIEEKLDDLAAWQSDHLNRWHKN